MKTKKRATKARSKKMVKEISDYDKSDSSSMINASGSLSFSDIGLKLPEKPPTEVVSIRLPTKLLNQIRAVGSENDIPYQALIKLFLAEGVKAHRKGSPPRSI